MHSKNSARRSLSGAATTSECRACAGTQRLAGANHGRWNDGQGVTPFLPLRDILSVPCCSIHTISSYCFFQ